MCVEKNTIECTKCVRTGFVGIGTHDLDRTLDVYTVNVAIEYFSVANFNSCCACYHLNCLQQQCNDSDKVKVHR